MHAKLNYGMPFRYIITNITSPIFAKSGFSLCPLLCGLLTFSPSPVFAQAEGPWTRDDPFFYRAL